MVQDIYPVPRNRAALTTLDADARAADYARSNAEPKAYWLDRAKRLKWITPPTRADESSFDEADFGVKWFADGQINVSVNSQSDSYTLVEI